MKQYRNRCHFMEGLDKLVNASYLGIFHKIKRMILKLCPHLVDAVDRGESLLYRQCTVSVDIDRRRRPNVDTALQLKLPLTLYFYRNPIYLQRGRRKMLQQIFITKRAVKTKWNLKAKCR
jgi:hypothetical protein